jgi:hypothetical protein
MSRKVVDKKNAYDSMLDAVCQDMRDKGSDQLIVVESVKHFIDFFSSEFTGNFLTDL